MRFKGNNRAMGMWFQTLISLYGPEAKIVDIQKSIQAVRG